jgi:hypothetical protein
VVQPPTIGWPSPRPAGNGWRRPCGCWKLTWWPFRRWAVCRRVGRVAAAVGARGPGLPACRDRGRLRHQHAGGRAQPVSDRRAAIACRTSDFCCAANGSAPPAGSWRSISRFRRLPVHPDVRAPQITPRNRGSAPQEEIREQEAQVLRRLIDARIARPTFRRNLVVLGDFNDTNDSLTVRTIRGRGATALIDTRPAERNGDTLPRRARVPRPGTWPGPIFSNGKTSTAGWITSWSVQGMAREWDPRETYVLAFPHWGEASDHRPVVATFVARDR